MAARGVIFFAQNLLANKIIFTCTLIRQNCFIQYVNFFFFFDRKTKTNLIIKMSRNGTFLICLKRCFFPSFLTTVT